MKGKKYGNTAPYGPAARGKTHIGGMFHQTKGKKHGNTAPYGPAARGKTLIGGNSLGNVPKGLQVHRPLANGHWSLGIR